MSDAPRSVVRSRKFPSSSGPQFLILITALLLWPAEAAAFATHPASVDASPAASEDDENTGTRVAKTDIVVMNNGDRITGEVKSLSRGLLEYSTNAMGTVRIQWDSIASLNSVNDFELELDSGERLFGSMRPGDAGELLVFRGPDTVRVGMAQVVDIAEVKKTFWNRWNGSLDLGFNFAQANSSTYWSTSAQATYRTQNDLIRLNLSNFLQSQDSAATTTRAEAQAAYQRFLGQSWFVTGVGQYEQNSELDLDFRFTLGGGGGRTIVHTRRAIMGAWVGLSGNDEQYTGDASAVNFQGILAWNYSLYTFGNLQTNWTSSVSVLPNLTTLGRVRVQINTTFKREIFNNFYVGLSGFETYDSEPPTGAEKNDFGITTSFGWSF